MKKKIKPKLKKYSDGGKEIKKAENFFKRENKKIQKDLESIMQKMKKL